MKYPKIHFRLYKFKNRERSGIVLILALLMMAAITASTIAVSVVISSTTSQSKNLDNFIIASLAADTGLERSLAVVKAGREGTGPNNNLTKAVSDAIFSSSLGNASFDVVTDDEAVPLIVPLLGLNQSFTFDLLATPSQPTPTNTMIVTGDSANGTSLTAILDISWVLIDANGNSEFTGRDLKGYSNFIISVPTALDLVQSENISVPSVFNGTSTILGYRVTIRALVGPVANVKITAPSSLPSSVAITSTGTAGSTRSIKTASVLWQLPASKLFNYVIFSEGPIIPCGSVESGC